MVDTTIMKDSNIEKPAMYDRFIVKEGLNRRMIKPGEFSFEEMINILECLAYETLKNKIEYQIYEEISQTVGGKNNEG